MKSVRLTEEEVERVSQRILRRFEKDSVLPMAALQYGLGEVAPWNARVEPRMLLAVLRQIARRTESQGSPLPVLEPVRSIFVDAGIVTIGRKLDRSNGLKMDTPVGE